MITFAILSLASMTYSILYTIHCFRLKRIPAAIGAILLALMSLALSVLLLVLLRF